LNLTALIANRNSIRKRKARDGGIHSVKVTTVGHNMIQQLQKKAEVSLMECHIDPMLLVYNSHHMTNTAEAQHLEMSYRHMNMVLGQDARELYRG
jgi:hypothetical protein